jgi:hypothetical protein
LKFMAVLSLWNEVAGQTYLPILERLCCST